MKTDRSTAAEARPAAVLALTLALTLLACVTLALVPSPLAPRVLDPRVCVPGPVVAMVAPPSVVLLEGPSFEASVEAVSVWGRGGEQTE